MAGCRLSSDPGRGEGKACVREDEKGQAGGQYNKRIPFRTGSRAVDMTLEIEDFLAANMLDQLSVLNGSACSRLAAHFSHGFHVDTQPQP